MMKNMAKNNPTVINMKHIQKSIFTLIGSEEPSHSDE